MEFTTSREVSAAAATATATGSGLGDDALTVEDAERFSSNRWPRQETVALLNIRSQMDAAFREAAIKTPLWEEISRKLSELGYNRSAKKCKEKFENVYKYHRRTKDGRSVKSNPKSYRFFEQLEALDSNHQGLFSSPDKFPTPMATASVHPENVVINAVPTSIHIPTDNPSTSATSTSSEESEGTRKKKRKLTRFFENLMKEVIEKQENLQKKFLDAIEKCEQERITREEAWKIQELERIKRERELLLEERSIAAAKDAAVLSFLQKFSEQNIPFPENQAFPEQIPEPQIAPAEIKATKEPENNNHLDSFGHTSSRWPKEEIETLIKLRTNLDTQYQDNGPKGPLWEEISAAMKKHGYNRNAKRCKEKWENMNKYFKRVRENTKRRAGDSKTCPYFNQLDALYKEKSRKVDDSGKELKPEELLMHMMSAQEEQHRQESTEDGESENADQNQDDDQENGDEDGFRVVANDPSSTAIMQ